MSGYLENFFEAQSFLAHGYCMTWRGDLIALHAVSDALIFVSYVLIPLAMLYFVLQRPDLAHKGIFGLFAAFILACGTTHLISLITLWEPIYGLEGLVKAITAAISMATVVATGLAIPKALRLPSPAMLREANLQLVDEVESHSRTNRDLIRLQDQLREHMRARAREMEAKASELERANESLRRFAHIASHDLQEPLRKISVYADLLEEAQEKGDTEDAERAVQRLRTMSTRARTMVSDLLRFSKMSQYEPARIPIDIGAAIREVAELFEHTLAASDGTLEIDVDDLKAEADPLLVRQIFQNIIGNAIKYVPKGRGPRIRVTTRREHNHRLIMISDNGIGFAPEFKSKIFEPFTRLHGRDVADGSGIGLAIVARAVQGMGWRIDVDTVPDKGTTFTLAIPQGDILV
ncbi:phospho-acceptor domain-containing protein [Breoghania corrubedonensis]|uniref:histidine kinase n=1 Tax=Breoghania corrubedonensis TaxID=665038 RepID=A0A2T5VEX0_9HYPH|nr:ATP-binding protein [Breoghania corrubedonensis]PTW62290.1 phospho-acceptor domain-containing protein [Breoghania corrubedonensis]